MPNSKSKSKSKIFQINNILNCKYDMVGKRRLYLVSWKGYTQADDTWEPYSNLRTCSNLVDRFNRRRKKNDRARNSNENRETGPGVGINVNTVKKQKNRTENKGKSGKITSRKNAQQVLVNPKTCSKNTNVKGVVKKMKSKSDNVVGKGLKSFKSANVKHLNIAGSKLKSNINNLKLATKFVKSIKSNKKDTHSLLVESDLSDSESGFLYSLSEQTVNIGGDVDKKVERSAIGCGAFANIEEAATPAEILVTKSQPKQFTSLQDHVYAVPSLPQNTCAATNSTYLQNLNVIADMPTESLFPIMPSSPVNSSFDSSIFYNSKIFKPNQSSDDEDLKIERRLSVRQTESAYKYKNIAVKKCHSYTQVWLNTQTRQKNALNPTVIEELVSVLNAAKFDDTCLLMLSALSGVFCSGVDLHFLLDDDKKVAALKMVDAVRDLCKTLINFPKPIIVVVNGPAIGLGTAILPLCDIVYASDKATFCLPYGRLRQTPEGCASYTLPSILGLAMANDMLIGGRKITATEAHSLGLVSRVLWPTSMMEEIIPYIDQMSLNSAKTMATTKLLVRSHQRTKLELTNESECNLLLDRWSTNECRRAIQSYLDTDSLS